MSVVNMMIVGVGGQGSLLASKLLGQLFAGEGCDVKVSEVHGMSQRGGSVVTYVRFGSKPEDRVYSPIVETGEADFIISFEKLEAARWVSCLKPDGHIIVNTGETMPMPVITGAVEYPHEVLESISRKGIHVDGIDAKAVALEAGSVKAVNVVLMGRLSRYFDIPAEKWLDALSKVVNPKFFEMNKRAFALGRG